MASITSGTPCPLASGAKFFTNQATTSAPATGTSTIPMPQGLAGVKTFPEIIKLVVSFQMNLFLLKMKLFLIQLA